MNKLKWHGRVLIVVQLGNYGLAKMLMLLYLVVAETAGKEERFEIGGPVTDCNQWSEYIVCRGSKIDKTLNNFFYCIVLTVLIKRMKKLVCYSVMPGLAIKYY